MTPNRYLRSDDNERTRFLTGDWLEQLTARALIESGADAAIPSAVASTRPCPQRGALSHAARYGQRC